MATSTIAKQKELFGHPVGLYILFLTEMWERFSFYGMKALLIFYLVKYHLFSDEAGNLLVGSYAALVYAMPVIGGYLADKFLGFRKAVTFGGIMLVLGHLGMAYEGNAATEMANGIIERDDFALQVFYFSLALIIVGVGFLKANISSIVGELYRKGDKRRDSGFTIFYMGINLGSALATIICSWLGETYGWSYGFGAAGVGMLFGLVTFIYGKKYFYGKAEPKDLNLLEKKSVLGINNEWTIYILAILGTVVVWQMVQNHSVVEVLLMIAGAGSLIYIIWYATSKATKIERDRLFALTVLILFSVIFWALFEQAYTSLNLFADRALDRETSMFGEIAPGAFLSLNAIFIILLAPVFAWLWIKLDKRGLNPNAAVKFSIGILLVGLGFGALVFGGEISGAGKVAMIWLVLAYFLHTCGELCLSPVGLSYVTKLSPGKIVGFMMGVWFLATAGSEYIASLLANLASIDTSGGKATDLAGAKASYLSLFESLFYTGLIFGVILLILSPFVKKMMHGIDSDESGEDEVLMEKKH
ncbi:peptide MFS transporter [Hyunsoonleella sp. SJ7]|uniref:Peptide MFS transporter n=1 Tax=Hyunsoonleella aquatilis TaxID=2762758 RepID=A0A923HCX8_9FLAO|nr:peptide MFS transporter [Hyunsoonleella aquatilis]MBC3757140.1 peptide MFS transporter [Hyunsoonleella aquatilis]